MDKILLIKKAKKLISSSNESECIEMLDSWFTNSKYPNCKKMHNDLRIISNNDKKNRRESIRATLSPDSNNKLIYSLLKFLDELEKLDCKAKKNYLQTAEIYKKEKGDIVDKVTISNKCIELTIDRCFDDYTNDEQLKLLEGIKNLLQIDGEIKIKQKRRGSLKLLLELTPAQCEKLHQAIKRGEFNKFNVIDSIIDPPLTKKYITERTNLNTKNLLIVDDDQLILKAMKTFLEKEGLDVTSAIDADEGLRILQDDDHDIDLIILDIIMPYKSGIEMLKEIQKINTKIPIIIVSALDRREVLEVAFKLGAEEFIKKPINISELIIKVNKALMKVVQGNP